MRRKLSFLFLLAALLLAGTAFAQAPQAVSYQAVVRHANNRLAVNQQVAVRISILKGSADGVMVYSELHNPTTNANGLFSVILGQGTPSNLVNSDFSAIDWANNQYFVKSEVDLDGSGDFALTSVQQMLSVPYALHAESAKNLIGLTDSLNDMRTTFANSMNIGRTHTENAMNALIAKQQADSAALAQRITNEVIILNTTINDTAVQIAERLTNKIDANTATILATATTVGNNTTAIAANAAAIAALRTKIHNDSLHFELADQILLAGVNSALNGKLDITDTTALARKEALQALAADLAARDAKYRTDSTTFALFDQLLLAGINLKVDTTDFNALTGVVNANATAIANKAEQSDLLTEIANRTTAVNGKVDTTDFNAQIGRAHV